MPVQFNFCWLFNYENFSIFRNYRVVLCAINPEKSLTGRDLCERDKKVSTSKEKMRTSPSM
jgi:hypothetical protein